MNEVNYIISIGNCCVPVELLKSNKSRSPGYLGNDSFLFDWARSNMKIVCDVVESGPDWYQKVIGKFYHNYQFKIFEHPHVPKEHYVEYLKKCSDNFFKVLQSNSNIIFLHMSLKELPIEDFKIFQEIILNKYPNLNFKIVSAISDNEKEEIKHVNINQYIDAYNCDNRYQFKNNKMRGEYYQKLFKTIIPYKLNIKSI